MSQEINLYEARLRPSREWLGARLLGQVALAVLALVAGAAIWAHARSSAREAVAAEPDKDELKLDLVLALLKTGEAAEAERLLDALPANLATDDRAVKARARLGFAAALKDAPSPDALRAALQADPDDLRARHLLGVHALVAGDSEQALEQFLDMLKRDRAYEDGLARKSPLILP